MTPEKPRHEGEWVSIRRWDLIQLKQLVGIVEDMQEAKETLPLLGRIDDALASQARTIAALHRARQSLSAIGRHYPDCLLEPCTCGLQGTRDEIDRALSQETGSGPR